MHTQNSPDLLFKDDPIIYFNITLVLNQEAQLISYLILKLGWTVRAGAAFKRMKNMVSKVEDVCPIFFSKSRL